MKFIRFCTVKSAGKLTTKAADKTTEIVLVKRTPVGRLALLAALYSKTAGAIRFADRARC